MSPNQSKGNTEETKQCIKPVCDSILLIMFVVGRISCCLTSVMCDTGRVSVLTVTTGAPRSQLAFSSLDTPDSQSPVSQVSPSRAARSHRRAMGLGPGDYSSICAEGAG